MMKKWFHVVFVMVLLLTVFGAGPAGAGNEKNGKICLVTEPAGFSPFNAMAIAGLEEASRELHVEAAILWAMVEADIVDNLEAFVTAGDCNLIIGVGFVVGMYMEPFVFNYPGQAFTILDSPMPYYPNLSEVVFNVDEAGFLAGYIAGGVSETGKVGVFGGLDIPPVTRFMDGYALGVEYYNAQNGASVEVLGWDPYAHSGIFSGFWDPTIGRAISVDLYDMGADIIFPVAGVIGYEALYEARERRAVGDKLWVIGVDHDWYEFFGDPDNTILTSVIKDYAPAVYHQVEMILDGSWEGGWYLEGLAGGGVDIAKFHKTNRDVPGYLKNDLKAIREGIISGEIPTEPDP